MSARREIFKSDDYRIVVLFETLAEMWAVIQAMGRKKLEKEKRVTTDDGRGRPESFLSLFCYHSTHSGMTSS